jgi:mRNA interferase MazF
MKKTKLNLQQGYVYLANLNPRFKAEPGKTRPVVVIQTDLLNNTHPTTIICPITTNIQPKAKLLRVHLAKNEGGLVKASDVLVDQIRAIDNARFVKQVGKLNKSTLQKLQECVASILD